MTCNVDTTIWLRDSLWPNAFPTWIYYYYFQLHNWLYIDITRNAISWRGHGWLHRSCWVANRLSMQPYVDSSLSLSLSCQILKPIIVGSGCVSNDVGVVWREVVCRLQIAIALRRPCSCILLLFRINLVVFYQSNTNVNRLIKLLYDCDVRRHQMARLLMMSVLIKFKNDFNFFEI